MKLITQNSAHDSALKLQYMDSINVSEGEVNELNTFVRHLYN